MANTIPHFLAPPSNSGRRAEPDPLKQAQAAAMNSVKNNNFLLRLSAENIANQNSAGYRRKMGVVKEARSPSAREIGKVAVARVVRDTKTPLVQEYDPASPQANEAGYVIKSNVDMSVEMVDMMYRKESHRASTKAYKMIHQVRAQLVDLLK